MINRNNILTPEIAEICGIHAGDGHLRKKGNEFELSGSFEEREYYDSHVIPLFNKVFNLQIKGKFFPSKGTYGFSICNKKIALILNYFDFPHGKKNSIVTIPTAIISSHNKEVKRSFLRGIFDTDGTITFDKKINNKNIFQKTRNFYPRIMLTTVSQNLAQEVILLCTREGFKAKSYKRKLVNKNQNRKYSIQIVGKEAMKKWVDKIKPKNEMKLSRYRIWKRYGFCPPNTTYQERRKILIGELNPTSLYKGPVV